MKLIDKLLQKWRVNTAVPFIPPDANILDIGCNEGETFGRLSNIASYTGIDPLIKKDVNGTDFKGNVSILKKDILTK